MADDFLTALKVSSVLTSNEVQFMAVAVTGLHGFSAIYPAEARFWGLVRIPAGLGPMDLGRKFKWAPTENDATAFALIP
jgi:hypothetical protein